MRLRGQHLLSNTSKENGEGLIIILSWREGTSLSGGGDDGGGI